MKLFVGLLLALADASNSQNVNEPYCEQEGCNGAGDTWTQMLIQLTQHTKTPVIDEDADFLEDADNPLEKMYAWEDGRAPYDESTESLVDESAKISTQATSGAHDMIVMEHRDEDPDNTRKTKKGNDSDSGDKSEEADFDCEEGESHWERGWSDMKKKFCCRTHHVGCNTTACVTREEPRAKSAFYKTSPAGTPCVFGVDPRDEGSHCILEDDSYGSFGWCFTSESKSSWGSCSESCPLFGPSKVIGARIDKMDTELGAKVRAEVKKALGEENGDTTSEPAAESTTRATPGKISAGKTTNAPAKKPTTTKKTADSTDSKKTSKPGNGTK